MTRSGRGAPGPLARRRALVTGGGTGIGRQLAAALVDAGAHVTICGRRTDVLSATTADLASSGGHVDWAQADVAQGDDLRELVASVGPIDILVNNAGFSRLRPWLEVPIEEWREVMAVNVEAPFRLCQLLVPGMMERGWGRVVNIASVYGTMVGNPYYYPGLDWDNASYVASKHALLGLTKHLGVRTARSGVTVNAISPGMFPDTDANRRRSLSPEVNLRLSQFTPMGRTGDLKELTTALLFLTDEASSFITGQNIVVDGGWSLW